MILLVDIYIQQLIFHVKEIEAIPIDFHITPDVGKSSKSSNSDSSWNIYWFSGHRWTTSYMNPSYGRSETTEPKLIMMSTNCLPLLYTQFLSITLGVTWETTGDHGRLSFTTVNIGRLDSVEWNGGLEWNGNKLDTSNWFSPPYNDHLWTNTTS